MNKRQLAAAVAPKVQLLAAQVERVIQATMDHLADELARQGRLEYRDLGTFTVEDYQARKIHNPKTGQTIQLPARKLVRFKPGRTLMTKIQPPQQKEKCP